MSQPRVLFVSKPVAPPFHDGSVCLVRDMARYLPEQIVPTVLSTPAAPPLGHGVRMARIYPQHGAFAPALQQNARTVAHLLADRRHDLWHFVFAPNPRSSAVGALLKKLRRKPVVQTVASRPRSVDRLESLLFGDHIIALSEHTAAMIRAQSSKPVHVIPPPCPDLSRDLRAQKEARRQAGVPWEAPMLIYAGDLEFSSGAWVMAQVARQLLEQVDDLYVVFACRAKSPRSVEVERRLKAELSDQRVRWVGEMDDLPALMASAVAMPFPVDDLYGKVDLPYVLLEAALLRVPAIVPETGPLPQIPGAIVVSAPRAEPFVQACLELLRDDAARRQRGDEARARALERHDPTTIGLQLADLYRSLV